MCIFMSIYIPGLGSNTLVFLFNCFFQVFVFEFVFEDLKLKVFAFVFNPLSTDIYVTFHPYVVRCLFLAKRSCLNACNWRQAQADERG